MGSAERKEHLHKENVPNLRFPEFSGEWGKTKFENIVSLQRGSSPRPIIEYITKSEDGVNWVKIGDMPASGRIVTRTEEKITREGAKKSRHVKIGDLILSNSMSFGQPYIMGIEGYIHDGWFVLRNYEKSLVRDYLCNLLISPSIQQQYKRLAAGGVVQNISSELVNSVIVSVPTKTEQKKIAEFISYIDDRIATQIKIIEKLESLIKGLCSSLFDKNKYDSFVRLGDISEITNGNSDVQDASLSYSDGMYPFFDRSEDIKFLPEYLLDKEAIIYPGEGSEFYPRYYNGKFALHQRCYAIYDIAPNFATRYLYFFCKTQNSYFVRNAVGSTVASLRLDTFKRLNIPNIPIEVQKTYIQLLDKIETKIVDNKTVLKKYEEQKKYLLSKMFI